MRIRHSLTLAGLVFVASACARVTSPPETNAPAVAPPDLEPTARAGAATPPAAPAVDGRIAVVGDPVTEPPRPDPLLDAPWTAHPEFEERQRWYEDLWTGRGAETFRTYLRRKGAYEALVLGGLAARGLPSSLQHVPIIESGYNPSAVSWAGAVGLWQLMSGTARDAGLTVTAVLDERRDPVRSTDVALDFLTELYDRFDSWPMALSAYNGGPARVARLARQHAPGMAYGDSVYFLIRPHLPRETRDFVPKLLAASRLAADPEGRGLGAVTPRPALRWDEVTVPDATSVDVLALAAAVEQDEIEALNPQLVRGFTPSGRETRVRVPVGRAGTFNANYAAIPPSERVTFLEHRVVRGDTFWDIARAYGVPVAVLEGANADVSPTRLQIGQWLVVPRAPSAGDRGRAAQAESAVVASTAATGGTHVVRSGDTLWGIARRYGTRVAQLRSWNSLSASDVIQPGDRLRVRP